LEGIICKQAEAPYQAGRGHGWLKVKCHGREEFIVLGWTAPGGTRKGLGSLHVGYYDSERHLHYAGGIGTGFTEQELRTLRDELELLAADAPAGLLVSGDAPGNDIHWVRPELVAEVQYGAWSGEGRLRHPVYLGLREDKPAEEVVRDVPDPAAKRTVHRSRRASSGTVTSRPRQNVAVPPLAAPVRSAERATARPGAAVVVARAPNRGIRTIGGIRLTHADRQLWPDITKLELAEYWQAVAEAALPGLARRPLGIVRCPEGVGRERFFQKRTDGLFPPEVRDGSAEGSPYLAIDEAAGLIAMAQMSAIELHAWGAREGDPLHPDWVVFDLDPGDDVSWAEVVRSAHDVRARLERLGLISFCRTTGGKGLHVVVPLAASSDWDWERVKAFCRAFAELMTEQEPHRYVAHVKIADRRGRVLVDWLRNAIGNTAIGSFCPRARPGATVATPLAWDEVASKLDPTTFTIATVPDRLARLRQDAWRGFFETKQNLPDLDLSGNQTGASKPEGAPRSVSGTRIVYARKPRPRGKREG
ncbi:MAG: DNA ligase D, partial [Acetobacteraceae bacterium]|nr:DNA ligase D [Acetobacteraceae bacterium]